MNTPSGLIDSADGLGLFIRLLITPPFGPTTDPAIPVTSYPPTASSGLAVLSCPVTVKLPSNDVKVILNACALLVLSLSAGVPEMTPVCALMLRPAGKEAEKVRASPAAGAAKWLETLSEKAWPSLALWSAMAVAVGPLSPTAR